MTHHGQRHVVAFRVIYIQQSIFASLQLSCDIIDVFLLTCIKVSFDIFIGPICDICRSLLTYLQVSFENTTHESEGVVTFWARQAYQKVWTVAIHTVDVCVCDMTRSYV